MNISLHIYLGVYILLLLGISYFISRKQSSEDFLIGGRKRRGWQIFASKFAASIGAGYFITYTGFAYEYGLGVFTLIFGLVLGFLIFGYWAAPKIYAPSKQHKFYTIGDFVYYKTKSKRALYVADVLSSTILFGWLLTGIIGGAKIINDFGLLSYSAAVILTAAVVLAYILLAGFKAVIVTDIIQSIIIALLLIAVTFGIVGSENLGTLFSVETGGVDIGTAVGFLLFGILSVFSYSDRYQLSYCSKSERGLKHGIALAVIPILAAASFLLLVGLFMAKQVPGLDSGLVFTEALKNFLAPALLPFAVVLFFAGVMSSADTNIYAIASHFAFHRKGNPVQKIRNATIGLIILTALLAIIYPDVVDVSILAGGISLTLSFPMIYLLFEGRNTGRFFGSVIGGVLGLLVGIAILGIEPIIALTVLFGGLAGLVYKSKS